MVFISLILFFFGNFFHYSPLMVKGHSMTPSLHDGEFLFIDNAAYREILPQRGDIIVFRMKNAEYPYIKRIIGLPGDHVHIRHDGIYFENYDQSIVKLDEPYFYQNSENQSLPLRADFDHVFIVPSGKYFVLGDNREQSFDSRFFKDPFVSKEQIMGKYLFTISRSH